MIQFKQSEITRAIAMYNVLHAQDFQYEQAHSFLSCLDMVLEQEEAKRKAAANIPVIEAGKGEDLLNAVGRAVQLMKPVNLMYDGKEIHIDPAMTLADAFAHAQYVLQLNETFPVAGTVKESGPGIVFAGEPQMANLIGADGEMPPLSVGMTLAGPVTPVTVEMTVPVGEPLIQSVGRGVRPYQEEKLKEAGMMTLDHSKTVVEPKRPEYERMTDGPILQQQRTETVEDVIARLMPLAPMRARISGLTMTIQAGYTVAEMIAEAHHRIANRISDEEPGEIKTLEYDEEMLDDGTIRTAKICWRKGYPYRLSVRPHDRTKSPEFYIHMKERPSQLYMNQYLPMIYEKQGHLFLEITNGFNRSENITHFFCTAAGRRGISELANIEKTLLGESRTIERVKAYNNVSAAPSRKSTGPFFSDAWENPECGFRVKYWSTHEKRWSYSYLPTKPGGMACKIRDVKGYPASIEYKQDFTHAPA